MNVSRSEYFQRQTVIPDIGAAGLEKLRKAKATVVGVGGVGATIADFLARCGVGFLRLIDQDIVEPSNLHRLVGVGRESLYRPKSEVVASTISKKNPWTRIDPVVETLRPSNLTDLLVETDVIIDGLDNFRTRYYLNRHSLEEHVPYIFTSAIATQGHVGIFAPPETPCLACAFPSVVDRLEETCEVLGIIPPVVGIVGAIAANEAVKILVGLSTTLDGGLLTVDMACPDFLLSRVPRRDDCKACGVARDTGNPPQGTLTILCGEKTFNIVPPVPLSLDLRTILRSLPQATVLTEAHSLLVYRVDKLTVSLFKSGRLLIKGADGEHEALSIARELWSRVSPESSLVHEVV
jgi:adenylyltransferase/sulfurtransferase